MTTNTSPIMVHKSDEEGAFIVDRKTGSVLTPSNEMPQWAEGLVSASLASRVGWYEQRLGAQLPEAIRSPSSIEHSDLDWVAVDEAGDYIDIEHNAEYRTGILGTLMGVDLEDFDNFEKNLGAEITSRLVDYSYSENPAGEETLAEAEGQSFKDSQLKAVNE